MQDLTVTVVQTTLDWHQPERNRARFEQLIDGIVEPTQVILLPEMFTTGFTMDAAAVAETMDGPSLRWMADLAARRQAVIAGSLIIEEDGRHYNRFVWMPPDGAPATYDKRHPFSLAEEHLVYTAGTERAIIDYEGWRVCPMVCYDLRFPVWSRSRNDYDLLVYVANWPSKRSNAWRTLVQARAIENACYAVGVNRIGVDGKNIPYDGDSSVVDYLGHTVVEPRNGEHVSSATLSIERLRDFRRKFPWHLDADDFTIQI